MEGLATPLDALGDLVKRPVLKELMGAYVYVLRGLSPAMAKLHEATELKKATLAAITGIVPHRRR